MGGTVQPLSIQERMSQSDCPWISRSSYIPLNSILFMGRDKLLRQAGQSPVLVIQTIFAWFSRHRVIWSVRQIFLPAHDGVFF